MTPEQELEYIHRKAQESEIWRKFQKKPVTR